MQEQKVEIMPSASDKKLVHCDAFASWEVVLVVVVTREVEAFIVLEEVVDLVVVVDVLDVIDDVVLDFEEDVVEGLVVVDVLDVVDVAVLDFVDGVVEDLVEDVVHEVVVEVWVETIVVVCSEPPRPSHLRFKVTVAGGNLEEQYACAVA